MKNTTNSRNTKTIMLLDQLELIVLENLATLDKIKSELKSIDERLSDLRFSVEMSDAL